MNFQQNDNFFKNSGKKNRPQTYLLPLEKTLATISVINLASSPASQRAPPGFFSLRRARSLRWERPAMLEYEIHPAIGIARVGSSRLATDEGYFIGPEPGVSPPANYRDTTGNLKRQAARFRIFACERDETRKLLRASEISLDSVRSITWTVHLANRKGTARRQYQSGPGFRNGPTQDDLADRELIIDPGPRTVRAPGDRGVFLSHGCHVRTPRGRDRTPIRRWHSTFPSQEAVRLSGELRQKKWPPHVLRFLAI